MDCGGCRLRTGLGCNGEDTIGRGGPPAAQSFLALLTRIVVITTAVLTSRIAMNATLSTRLRGLSYINYEL